MAATTTIAPTTTTTGATSTTLTTTSTTTTGSLEASRRHSWACLEVLAFGLNAIRSPGQSSSSLPRAPPRCAQAAGGASLGSQLLEAHQPLEGIRTPGGGARWGWPRRGMRT
eukprot:4618859-Pyramimonas_sp.AAC.1